MGGWGGEAGVVTATVLFSGSVGERSEECLACESRWRWLPSGPGWRSGQRADSQEAALSSGRAPATRGGQVTCACPCAHPDPFLPPRFTHTRNIHNAYTIYRIYIV